VALVLVPIPVVSWSPSPCAIALFRWCRPCVVVIATPVACQLAPSPSVPCCCPPGGRWGHGGVCRSAFRSSGGVPWWYCKRGQKKGKKIYEGGPGSVTSWPRCYCVLPVHPMLLSSQWSSGMVIAAFPVGWHGGLCAGRHFHLVVVSCGGIVSGVKRKGKKKLRMGARKYHLPALVPLRPPCPSHAGVLPVVIGHGGLSAGRHFHLVVVSCGGIVSSQKKG
jgi:hypothetical protein